jgi:hypothetical protein
MKITITVETEPSESSREIAGFLRAAAERLENAVPGAVGSKAERGPLP